MPLFFIANQGQAPAEVRFMAKGSGLTAFFLQKEIVFRTPLSSVRMRMEGSNPAALVEGADRLAGRVSFLTGAEENWHTGLPTYGAVAYRGLYPGIDLVYGGNGRNLKSEFVVASGADPSQIRVRYIGAGAIRIDGDGGLEIPVNGEVLHERAPEVYQDRNGQRVAVKGGFSATADGAIGFAIGQYDRSLPLVIDPVISYSTFLGGSGADAADALAVDSTGAVYVAGFTASYNFPTLNPVQAANAGGNDVFVAKLSAAGNALVYATYLGGSGDDRAFGIAVDSTGAAYVTGWTQSSNFPVRNALQAGLAGGQNAFLVKLTPAGNGFAYSTLLGGNGSDSGNGIAVDSSGNAYVVGDTTSTNFPATGFQTSNHGGQDAFVAKLNAGGSSLTYSTYLGGGNLDHGAAIAVDGSGTVYVTGSTTSTDFPVANAFQGTNGGGENAFIARLSANGASLLFSTFLGGSGGRTGYPEAGQGIAIDSSGNAYVAGVTSSANFPLVNPEQSTLDGSSDAFIAKMSSAGSLVYSTYLGGSGMDAANAIAVDSSGNVYVAGYTYSIDLPVVSAVQSTIGSVGSTDAFVGKLNPAGNSLLFLSYLGGNDSDTATGVAVDASGNVYVVGWTLSSNFPTLNAYQTSNAGNYGAFVTKYTFIVGPVNVGVTPNSGGGPSQTFSLAYSDSNGASDLTAVGALFNTSSSPTNGCSVTYNRAQNTLALLTNAGAQPASTITPGSGSQQNSQCILSGAGSTASLSGDLLTLNLAITFLGAFDGAKNVYMQSSNPSQTTAWQTEGTWSVPAAITLAVTPSSGNATQQTFSFLVTDPLGAVADLTSVGVLFNSSISIGAACSVTYTLAQNTLALTTDAGAQSASTIAPGSGTQQNSQCILNGAGSSVSMVGNALTVNLALTFLPAFGGAKNVYMDVASQHGPIGWVQEGAWTSPPLVTMAISPSSGSGNQQTFRVQVSDSTGAADLTTIGVLWNATPSTTAACAVTYNQAQNALMLLTNTGAQQSTSITPGAGTQQNSQCILNGSGSSVSVSGNTLTVALAVSFLPAFAGAKNVYTDAANPYETVAWQVEGAWAVTSGLVATVTPSTGSGGQQTFNLQVSDPAGASDLTTVGLMFNSAINTVAGCVVLYNSSQNTLMLLTDAGALPAASITPGAGTSQNSQCVLNGAGSSAASGGNVVSLNLSISFQPAFTGTKNLYAEAIGVIQALNWQQEGIWSVSQTVTMGLTPSSGSATQQTFSIQILDPLGAADLTTVGFLFNTTSAAVTTACAITFNRALNTLTLLTDAGASPGSSITPGAGSQQNSQCVLSGSGSSVTTSVNTLTLNLALTFLPFSGTRNLYLEAASSLQAATWTLEGAWGPPPVVTMSVSPAAGGGPQQVFALQVSDSLAATDLTTVGILFNTSVSTVSACAVMYNRAQNALTLLTDAGAAPASSITPGGGSQQNSQCTLNGSGSSVTASGTTLTLNLSLSFPVTWVGSQTVYIEAVNPTQSGTWTSEGHWVTSASLTVSGSPTSGSGAQATFTILANESWAASDVTTAGLLINSSSSLATGCAVMYNVAQNTLALLTDAGTSPAGTITPGSGSQQNSQCVLNGVGSSATAVGTVLTVNVSVSFLPAFAGTKNMYVDAVDPFRTLGWALQGTWNVVVAALPDLTVTSTHTGNFTQGQSGATYTITATNSGNLSTSGTVTVSETLAATGLTAVSMLGSNWSCTQPAGPCSRSDVLAAGLSYNPITVTVNVSATAPASVTNTVTVAGGGEVNTANDQATDPTTITAVTAFSIWPASAVPANPFLSYSPITVGVKFYSSVSGNITSIRFYKGAGNSGTHIGLLYSASGTLLAQATFTGETASGWQQVNLATPVAITANTVYVAAYFSTTGFAYNLGYFTNTGQDNAPLHAVEDGVDGPNAVYASGAAAQFPTSDGLGSNYWADVVFSSTVTSIPDLTVASSHIGNFTQGQNAAVYTITATNSGTGSTSGTVTVAEALPAGLTAVSMLGNNWTCTQPIGPCTRGDALATGLSYDTITVTVNVSATAPSSVTNTVTVAGGGETNTSNDQATDPTTITSTAAGTSNSIWPASAVPTTPFLSYAPVTLGVKFYSDVSGSITSLRFYKGAGSTGTHIGLLYSANGTLLAQATFTGETASGWQQVSFASPVAIAANTVYVAAYFSTTGFAYSAGYFTSTGVNNAPLHAVEDGVDGPNGTYATGATALFPASDGLGSNYWADVVFTATGASVATPGTPDLTVASSHIGNFTQGQNAAVYTITATNSGAGSTSGTVTVAETLPAGLTAVSMLGNNWTCTQPIGPCTRSDALAMGLSYDTITVTVNVSATAPSSVTNTVTVSGGGEVNTLNDQATDPTTITSTSPGTATSIWPVTAVPASAWLSGPPTTVGVKFQSDVSGFITGIRFYKGPSASGTQIGLLYAASGTLMAQATFTSETTSGWQQVSFFNPVAITANTVYVAAYFSTTGYAYTAGYFTSTGADNAPLHALEYGVSGPNGVYNYESGAQFPAFDGGGANYWADVVFTATGSFVTTPNTPDLIVASNQAGNFTQGQINAVYTITATNSGTGPTNSTVTVAETLPAGLTAVSMLGNNWTCVQPIGPCTRSDSLAAGLSYDTIDVIVDISSTATSSVTNIVTVSGGGEINTLNDQSTDLTTIAPITTGVTTSIWPASAVPTTPYLSYAPVTLGVKFYSDVSGSITSLRFYKGAGSTGTHIGLLYSANGTLLAQATFTGETASGWQQVNFASPVAIAASTVYVAAYFSTTGFAYSAGYFTSTGVNNAPLHAVEDGVDGPNGTYATGATALFPASDGLGSNYWADVVFTATGTFGTTPGTPDLTVASSHIGNFTQGQNAAVYTITATNNGTGSTSGTVTVAEILPAGLTAVSMLGNNWTCAQPIGPCTRSDALAAGLNYDTIAVIVSVSSTAPSSVTNTVTVSGGGEINTLNDQATDPTTIATTPTGTLTSIWPASAAPANPWITYSPVTLGVKLYSDVSGSITSIRFYKGAESTGTHIGLLYSANGTLLAQATFSGETASGWQQVSFATPVAIAANTIYVAAYFSNTGFAYNAGYFTSTGVNNAPLHAVEDGVDGPNAVYAGGATAQFPASDGMGSNYWVDVVFSH